MSEIRHDPGHLRQLTVVNVGKDPGLREYITFRLQSSPKRM